MTRLFFVTGFLTSSTLMFPSFNIPENPQDLKSDKKEQKHIKLLKIDDEGNKTELDTVIENDDVFVWNGDTIGIDDEWTWVFDNDFHPDSVLKKLDFDIDIEENDSGETIVMKSHKGKPFIHRFNFDKDFPPRPPMPPAPPKVYHFDKSKRENIIDLSDPGIVSFKKSKKKDGLEKITIIRKVPDEKNTEVMEEIIIPDIDAHLSHFHRHLPPKEHRIKIFEGEDGTQIIEEDGKVIKIKKETKGDKQEIEVEVETKEEEKQEDN